MRDKGTAFVYDKNVIAFVVSDRTYGAQSTPLCFFFRKLAFHRTLIKLIDNAVRQLNGDFC